MEDSACGSFQLMVSAYQPSLWLAKLAPVDPLSTAPRPMGRSVEPAVKRHAQCLDRGVEHLTHLGRIGYVGDYWYGRSAGIFDGRCGFSRSVPIDVVNHDVCSGGPKSLGNGPADTPAGPSNHDDLTFM